MRKLIPLATVIAIAGCTRRRCRSEHRGDGCYEDHVQHHGVQPHTYQSVRRRGGPHQLLEAIWQRRSLGDLHLDLRPDDWGGDGHGAVHEVVVDRHCPRALRRELQFTSDTDATWENTIAVSGGTDGFKGVNGKGHETCRTTNAGATLTCTEAVEVTGLSSAGDAESPDQRPLTRGLPGSAGRHQRQRGQGKHARLSVAATPMLHGQVPHKHNSH